MHIVAKRLGEITGNLPFRLAAHRLHDLANPADAPLRIGERAVLFQERCARQKDMRVLCGLVQKQILDHDAFHAPKASRHVLRIRIGLSDIFALDVEAL